MDKKRLVFIGGGNMAEALIGGLTARGWPADAIVVVEPRRERREYLREHHAVETAAAIEPLSAPADVLLLAVKPDVVRSVCRELGKHGALARALVVSIAAGVRTASICDWLGDDFAVVRAMPNTPATVGHGASALFATPRASDEQRRLAERLLAAVGTTVWLEDEEQLDVVTALSGSGPAYFFRLMESLEDAAAALGLERDIARSLTVQTALGAAVLARESDAAPAELRRRVTSPGGTTEQALARLDAGDIRGLVAAAVAAAAARSRELSEQAAS